MSEIQERFSAIYDELRTDEVISFPVRRREDEVIFKYKVRRFEKSFIISEIQKVASRNLKDNQITIFETDSIWNNEILKHLNENASYPKISGSSAISLTKSYYEIHNKVLSIDFELDLSNEENDLLTKYIDTLNLLVGEGGLARIYELLLLDINKKNR
jgi:hypothetical protein